MQTKNDCAKLVFVERGILPQKINKNNQKQSTINLKQNKKFQKQKHGKSMSAYSDQPISLDKDIWQQALVPATNVSRDDDVEIWINSVLVYKIPMGHISYRESKSWVWGNLVLRLSLSLWPFAVPDDGLVELLNAINNHVPVEVKSPFYRNTFVTEHVRFLPGEDMGNYTDCAELELFLNLGM